MDRPGTSLSQHTALRIIVGRALLLFVLVTIVMSTLSIESPLGVVPLVSCLGWIDLRRRRESLFWANLGYSAWLTTGVFAASALVGRTLFAVLVRPLVGSLTELGR